MPPDDDAVSSSSDRAVERRGLLGALDSLRMPRANSSVPLLVRLLLLTRSKDALMNCPACKMSLREMSFGNFAVDIAAAVACIQSSSRTSDTPTDA